MGPAVDSVESDEAEVEADAEDVGARGIAADGAKPAGGIDACLDAVREALALKKLGYKAKAKGKAKAEKAKPKAPAKGKGKGKAKGKAKGKVAALTMPKPKVGKTAKPAMQPL